MNLNLTFARHEGKLYVSAQDADNPIRQDPYVKVPSVKNACRQVRAQGHTIVGVSIAPYKK